MRVYLVAPSREEPGQIRPAAFPAPPLNLATLAGLTPTETEVTIADEQVERIDFEHPADLVGITVSTHTAPRAYRIADAFRARGRKVVLGGIHPTVLPEEASQHADAVVVGEAETTWPQLISDLQAGRLQPIYRTSQRPNLAGLPLPRRDLLRRRSYLIPDTIYTTRGCPFDCAFCSVTSFFGHSYRCRPVPEVVEEIQALPGRRMVLFVDDNIIGHRGYSRQLFRAMAPLKMNWIGQASITIAGDEALLAEARASGCRGLFLGIESISPVSLRAVDKRHNHVEEYELAIRRIHAHGIAVVASFIFGFDEDTEDVFEATVRFAQRNRVESAHFAVLIPYPGTRLMQTFDKEGRLLTKDWSQYREDRVVYEPRQMSAARLLEGRDWAWREFYSLGSIWSRIGINRPLLPLVWAMNLNYRDDFLSRELFDRFARLVSSHL